MESRYTKGASQIRLGKEVLKKTQIRKQLIAEVSELLGRLEQLEIQPAIHQPQALASYQRMIHQRCNTLAMLCAVEI
ncbi:MAG: hypothetical protein H6999_02975 [Hahellaceae bacterium]|nr:hypothetical protein [Hahellaceae bacterium]MCP5168707.1 hypothetical protein [Hahellaceae bacterium]